MKHEDVEGATIPVHAGLDAAVAEIRERFDMAEHRVPEAADIGVLLQVIDALRAQGASRPAGGEERLADELEYLEQAAYYGHAIDRAHVRLAAGAIRAALREAPRASQWRAIAEFDGGNGRALISGEPVRDDMPRWVIVGEYDAANGKWWSNDDELLPPTHWMPVPLPPAPSGTEEDR